MPLANSQTWPPTRSCSNLGQRGWIRLPPRRRTPPNRMRPIPAFPPQHGPWLPPRSLLTYPNLPLQPGHLLCSCPASTRPCYVPRPSWAGNLVHSLQWDKPLGPQVPQPPADFVNRRELSPLRAPIESPFCLIAAPRSPILYKHKRLRAGGDQHDTNTHVKHLKQRTSLGSIATISP
jgi:hypothetical protein